MRFPQIAVLLVAILSGPVVAQQTPNPVTPHYRAYREALARGDLATADAEATAALVASQLRDGNGGSTPALALNTAFVRLSEGHREQALVPAQLAATLVNGPQSHLDPLIVDIAVKRALLRLGDQSEADLLAALNTAQSHGAPDEFVYDGAADLGAWSTDNAHFETAVVAWQLASNASPGNTEHALLSRADAMIGYAIAMFKLEIQSDPGAQPHQSTPLPLSQRISSNHANPEVYRVLARAAGLVRPLAEHAAPDGSVTRAQLLHSQAIAFLRADYSRLDSYNLASSLPSVSGSLRLAAHPGADLCDVRPNPQPMPTYPPAQQRDAGVGAVVARFVIDASGHVTDARVVATVGGQAFARSVSTVIGRWRVERNSSSAPNCEMAMTLFVPISFFFE